LTRIVNSETDAPLLALSPRTFRSRETVKAVQMAEPFTLQKAGDFTDAEGGDYVVLGEDGTLSAVPRGSFESAYEEVT
jgi:hypothetical protein